MICFTDQVNIIHVIVGGNRKSTKLNYPDKERRVLDHLNPITSLRFNYRHHFHLDNLLSIPSIFHISFRSYSGNQHFINPVTVHINYFNFKSLSIPVFHRFSEYVPVRVK